MDNALGTDDLNHGTGPGAAAFASIGFAWNAIAPLYGGGVVINISNAIYNEDLNFNGKNATNSIYAIYLKGTMVITRAVVAAAGSVKGVGAIQGTLVDNVGGMGVNAHANKLLVAMSGVNNGSFRIIDANTANTFTICGTWDDGAGGGGAPAAGDSYEVRDWGTRINGSLQLPFGMKGLIAQNIDFTHATLNNYLTNMSQYEADACRFNASFTVEANAVALVRQSLFLNTNGYFNVTSGALGELVMSKVIKGGPAAGLFVEGGGRLYIDGGCVVEGVAAAGNIGLFCRTNGNIFFDPLWSNTWGNARIRNWNVGINSVTGGVITGTGTNQYAGNNFNELPDVPTYGYID